MSIDEERALAAKRQRIKSEEHLANFDYLGSAAIRFRNRSKAARHWAARHRPSVSIEQRAHDGLRATGQCSGDTYLPDRLQASDRGVWDGLLS
jgi:hypothetical protein